MHLFILCVSQKAEIEEKIKFNIIITIWTHFIVGLQTIDSFINESIILIVDKGNLNLLTKLQNKIYIKLV